MDPKTIAGLIESFFEFPIVLKYEKYVDAALIATATIAAVIPATNAAAHPYLAKARDVITLLAASAAATTAANTISSQTAVVLPAQTATAS